VIILHIEAETVSALEARLRADFAHLFDQPPLPLSATLPTPAHVLEAVAAAPQETDLTVAVPVGRKPRGKAAATPAAAPAETAPAANGHAPEATPAAPTIELPALRELMGELVAKHPQQGAIVKALLTEHAEGAVNLSGTDPRHYDALAAAARGMLAGLAADPTA